MYYLRWTATQHSRPMYAIVQGKRVTWSIKASDASVLKESAARRLLKTLKGGYLEMVPTDEV
jgi:hypothetical protein